MVLTVPALKCVSNTCFKVLFSDLKKKIGAEDSGVNPKKSDSVSTDRIYLVRPRWDPRPTFSTDPTTFIRGGLYPDSGFLYGWKGLEDSIKDPGKD